MCAVPRYTTAQKIYMLDTHEELFKLFQKQHPGVKLQLKKFIDLAPWCCTAMQSHPSALVYRYVSTSKQETCLCKACENFTCYEKVLGEVVGLVEKELLHGCEDEGELPGDERDPVLDDQGFKRLKEFLELKRRIGKVST